jgi:hypothetical protein
LIIFNFNKTQEDTMLTPLILALVALLYARSTDFNVATEKRPYRALVFVCLAGTSGLIAASLLGLLVPRQISATYFKLQCLPTSHSVSQDTCELEDVSNDASNLTLKVIKDPLVQSPTMKISINKPDVTSPLYPWSFPVTRTSISIQQPGTSTSMQS